MPQGGERSTVDVHLLHAISTLLLHPGLVVKTGCCTGRMACALEQASHTFVVVITTTTGSSRSSEVLTDGILLHGNISSITPYIYLQ